MDLKQAAISISMIVFVLSSMLGMGLGLRVSEIVAPLRNWRLVMLSLAGELRRDAVRRARAGENPAPGRVDGRSASCCWAWPAARRSCQNSRRSPKAISRLPSD